MLRAVLPECVELESTFKVVADRHLLDLVNSKNYPRGGAGKFITIYPGDESTFAQLIERLYVKTKDFGGPYILSDKRYKDSQVVFYRYGSFLPQNTLNVDGTKTPVIYSPTGHNIPDERHPYFHLPDWVRDPFPDPVSDEEADEEESEALHDRFLVEEALAFSNAGGVYKGMDMRTNQPVLLKEARPFTSSWSAEDIYVDSIKLLEREYAILQKLKFSPYVPNPIDFFTEWEHAFLIEEYVEGLPLTRYRALESVIVMHYIHDADRVAEFCSIFKSIALQALEALRSFHEQGVILGDVSPGNILVNRETRQLWFIDFECAYDPSGADGLSDLVSTWSTPGFRMADRGTRHTVTTRDDFYALGMTLYSLVIPIQKFFDFNPPIKEAFINRLLALGLPSEIKHVIFGLVEGDAEGAEKILKDWPVEVIV